MCVIFLFLSNVFIYVVLFFYLLPQIASQTSNLETVYLSP